MQRDFDRGLIWLPTAIEHMGPPANPNIVRGYCRALKSMPRSSLILEEVAAYRPFLEGLGGRNRLLMVSPRFVEPGMKYFAQIKEKRKTEQTRNHQLQKEFRKPSRHHRKPEVGPLLAFPRQIEMSEHEHAIKQCRSRCE